MPTMMQQTLALVDRIERIMQENKNEFGSAFAPTPQADIMRILNRPEPDEPSLLLTDILEQAKPHEAALLKILTPEQKELWNDYKDAQQRWIGVCRGEVELFSDKDDPQSDLENAFHALEETFSAEQEVAAEKFIACWRQPFKFEISPIIDGSFVSSGKVDKLTLLIPAESENHHWLEMLFFEACRKLEIISEPLDSATPQLTFRFLPHGLFMVQPDEAELPDMDFAAIRRELKATEHSLTHSRWRKIPSTEGDIYEHLVEREDNYLHIIIHAASEPDVQSCGHPLRDYVQRGAYRDSDYIDIDAEEDRIMGEMVEKHGEDIETLNEELNQVRREFFNDIKDLPRVVRISGPLVKPLLAEALGVQGLSLGPQQR